MCRTLSNGSYCWFVLLCDSLSVWIGNVWQVTEVGKICKLKGSQNLRNLQYIFVSRYWLPTQTPEENWSDHMQSPGRQPTLCVAWCLIWWFAVLESIVIHDTECPYWDQVSLNITNHHQILIVSGATVDDSLSFCYSHPSSRTSLIVTLRRSMSACDQQQQF